MFSPPCLLGICAEGSFLPWVSERTPGGGLALIAVGAWVHCCACCLFFRVLVFCSTSFADTPHFHSLLSLNLLASAVFLLNLGHVGFSCNGHFIGLTARSVFRSVLSWVDWLVFPQYLTFLPLSHLVIFDWMSDMSCNWCPGLVLDS